MGRHHRGRKSAASASHRALALLAKQPLQGETQTKERSLPHLPTWNGVPDRPAYRALRRPRRLLKRDVRPHGTCHHAGPSPVWRTPALERMRDVAL